MPTISAGASTAVTVAVGTYLEGTGAGTAVIGAAAIVDPLTAGDAWQIGPFDRATVVSITAISDITHEVKEALKVPSDADRFTAAVAAALPPMVSGDANAVIVYGATPGGIAAAVAAARQNKRVFLLSESNRLGGMQGWGITQTDFEVNSTAGTVSGMPKEFWGGIGRRETLGSQVFQRYHRNSAPGFPSWFTRAFDEMVAKERNITVAYNCHTPTVIKGGTDIVSLTVVNANGGRSTYTGGAFIDASYTGDLIAAAGCTVAIGRESTALYSEALAGITSPGTYASGLVDPYVTAGVPGSGLLPWLDGTIGTIGAGDGRVMTWTYRLFVTTVSADRIPFPDPDMARYNAAVAAGNFEILARAMAAASGSFDTMAEIFNMYPNVLATGYYDMNGKVGLTTNYPNHAELLEYVTATHARRLVIRENVKQWILQLLYWIRYSGDARIPGALVTEIATYGLCASELRAYGGGFVELYVREARRLVGDYVMRQSNVALSNGYTDEIGFLMYGFDTPQVRLVADAGVVKQEGSNLTALTTSQLGAKIPYRILLPKVAECTNLLSVCCASVSQVVHRTYRLEPTYMQTGQAAGIAAALKIDQGVSVQSISTARLKKIQDLYETAGATVCCVDPAFGGEVNPTYTPDAAAWASDATRFGFLSTFARTDGNASKGSKSVRFNFIVRETGAYEVFLRYPPQDTSTGPNNVPVTVSHADGTATRVVNMRYPGGDGGMWESLGVFTFRNKGGGATSDDYVLVETTGTSGAVVLSACKLVKATL